MPDSKKFFENLSGAGKSIGVLTSGGDAQGNFVYNNKDQDVKGACLPDLAVAD